MEKKHIYFMPGLGANPKIFEYILLPKDRFAIHLLEWKIPVTEEESIEDYAQRMAGEIKHQNPVLLGVSFGGVLVQEIAKIIAVEKVILVSSIKSHHELPNRLKLLQKTKGYKFFPAKIIENFEKYKKYFLGDFLRKRADIYTKYLSVNDAKYLKWALYIVYCIGNKRKRQKIQFTYTEIMIIFSLQNILRISLKLMMEHTS